MNFVHIAGHLGADPETRFTQGGQKVTTLRVATKNRKGATTWWRVSAWGDQFDKMIVYLKKGSPVMAFGEMKPPEIFTDRDGKPQVSMELTASYLSFSPFGKGAEGGEAAHASVSSPFTTQPEMANPYVGKASDKQGGDTFDDEVPF